MGSHNEKYGDKKARSMTQKASLAAARAHIAQAKSHLPTQATKENMPLTPSRIQLQYVISHLPVITPPRLFPVGNLTPDCQKGEAGC